MRLRQHGAIVARSRLARLSLAVAMLLYLASQAALWHADRAEREAYQKFSQPRTPTRRVEPLRPPAVARVRLVENPGEAQKAPGFKPSRAAPRFPLITKFPVVRVADVGKRLHDEELVLGVEIKGKARAYPINMLTGPQREIINDTLGSRAIAATW